MARGDELKDRTKQFALRIIRLYKALPTSTEAQVIGKQILRSGTAVGANYRAACCARSKRDFANKLGVVLEEADETSFWLELLAESGTVAPKRLVRILKESTELSAIVAASRITALGRGEDAAD